jgi:F0F1-type ATP synthase delta subunit
VLKEEVDERLLGGIRVEVRDEVIDLTVKIKFKNYKNI